ncbi:MULTISPECIES: DUF1830 domain-containing protein [unclassified Nostoc]
MNKILAFYVNDTPNLKIVRIQNIPSLYLKRVVFQDKNSCLKHY